MLRFFNRNYVGATSVFLLRIIMLNPCAMNKSNIRITMYSRYTSNVTALIIRWQPSINSQPIGKTGMEYLQEAWRILFPLSLLDSFPRVNISVVYEKNKKNGIIHIPKTLNQLILRPPHYPCLQTSISLYHILEMKTKIIPFTFRKLRYPALGELQDVTLQAVRYTYNDIYDE